MGRGVWPAPRQGCACGRSLFVVIFVLTKESMRMGDFGALSATEDVEQNVQR